MLRRRFVQGGVAMTLLPVAACAESGDTAEVTRSEAEWREVLSPKEFKIMRKMGTERAFTSQLNDVTAKGIFHCKGCDQAIYSSKTKFDSGTGWPSFTHPIENAVDTMPDPGLFDTRTEVHCDRCASHLGHIFDDGPEPTGKRHCINGICMVFRPAGGGPPIVG